MSDQSELVALPPMPDGWQREALRLIDGGAPLTVITSAFRISLLELSELLEAHPRFAARFHRARMAGLDARSDDLLTRPDDIVDELDAKRATLYSKNVQWLLERRLPQSYGRRDQVDVNVQVDIRAAIDEGRKRVDPSGLAAWLIGE